MKFWRGGVSVTFYVVMLMTLIAVIVAAAFNVLGAEWAAVAAAGPPILAALYASIQEFPRTPEEEARELARNLMPQLLEDSTAEMPARGLDLNRRITLKWVLAADSNPIAQRDAGLGSNGTLDQLVDAVGRQAAAGGQPRLVVTGVMGGGKTAACVLLTAELAERHGRLPVLLHLATWDPATSLRTWMAAQLPDVFPGIGRSKYWRRVAAILARRHILPLLDGLDEMREPSAALRAIDEQMKGQQFVLTCRTAEFQHANAGSVLHQALIVNLQPLRTEEVHDILLEYEPASVNGPLSTFVAALEADPTGPVAEALDTPLMVSLAREAGAPAPDLRAVTPGPDAADVIRKCLLGAFVSTAYSGDDLITKDQARRYLRFLAKHADSAGRIAWWMLYEAVPQSVFLTVAIVNAGVLCSSLGALFFALFSSPWLGFWIGLGAGVIGAVIDTLMPHQEPRRARPRFRSLRVPTPNELIRAAGFGVMGGAALSFFVWALYGPVRYIVIGGILSAFTYAAASYIGQPNDPLKVVTPRGLLIADRTTVGYAWLVSALAGALTGGYLGLSFRAGHRPKFGALALLHYPPPVQTLLGAACGCVLSGAGLGLMAMGASSWGRFFLTRSWLALRGSAPIGLMSFLNDAYERGVLRQVNGYYEFRHQILQRYLNDSDPELPTEASGALASPGTPP